MSSSGLATLYDVYEKVSDEGLGKTTYVLQCLWDGCLSNSTLLVRTSQVVLDMIAVLQ